MSDGITAMFDRIREENAGKPVKFYEKSTISTKMLIEICENHLNMIENSQKCLRETLEKLKTLV